MPDTAALEQERSHRPWPLPRIPWVMFQSWRKLLFAHWPVPADMLRELVPDGLTVEEFDGTGWLGITPFRLTGLRLRGLPALPGVSEFPEVNLRTYVRVGEKPGIFFFSLDAGSRPAVMGARTAYRLPYHHADMSMQEEDGCVRYRSRRDDGTAELVARYRPVGPVARARPGSLEHFLVERYALYVVIRGRVVRADIHHRPWELQDAEAEIVRNTLPDAHGITLPDRAPLLHQAERQDTLVWPPRRVS